MKLYKVVLTCVAVACVCFSTCSLCAWRLAGRSGYSPLVERAEDPAPVYPYFPEDPALPSDPPVGDPSDDPFTSGGNPFGGQGGPSGDVRPDVAGGEDPFVSDGNPFG